jgi:hypothetical protein
MYGPAVRREIFEYRDLGIKDGTNGDYVAHHHQAQQQEDQGRGATHVHDCTLFQLVCVLNDWATFGHEGQGQRTIRRADSGDAAQSGR